MKLAASGSRRVQGQQLQPCQPGETVVWIPFSAPGHLLVLGLQRNLYCMDLLQFSCGKAWVKRDEKNVNRRFARAKIGWCGVERDRVLG